MRLIPRTQKGIAWFVSGVCILLALASVGLLVVSGGLDSGDQLGTSEGFVPAKAPVGNATSTSWPEYGYNAERTRANPDLDLAPPFTGEAMFATSR